MANNIDIQEIIGQNAIQGIEDTTKALLKANDALNQQLSIVEDLNKQYQKIDSSVKLVQAIGEQEKKNLEIQKEKQSIEKENANIEKAVIEAKTANLKKTQEELKIKKQTIDIEIKERKENERLTKQKEKEAQAREKAERRAEQENRAYKKLTAELNKQRAAAKDLAAQYGTNSKQFKNAQKSVLELDEQVKKIDTSLGQHQRNVGNYASSLDNAFGSATTGLLNMTKAAMKFVATPLGAVITAIVLALKSLTTYFRSSEEGQNALNKVMKVFGVIVGNITDIVSDLGEKLFNLFKDPKQALIDFGELIKENLINRFVGMLELIPNLGKAIKLLFQGEFKEAGKVAADAMGKVAFGVENVTDKIKEQATAFIEETKKEITQAKQLADLQAELDKRERALIVDRAKLEAQIAKAREKAADTEKYSAQERYQALQEVRDLTDDLAKREIEIFKQRAYIKEVENSFSKSTKEDLTELENLRAKAFSAEQSRAATQRRIIKEQETARKEIIKLREEETRIENDLNATSLENTRLNTELKLNIEKDYAEKRLKIANDLYEAETQKLRQEEETQKELRDVALSELQQNYSLAFGLRQAQLDRELDALQNNYNAQILAAEGNTELQEALSRELAQKQYEIQLKQAKSEKAQAYTDILINTAIGVSQALAKGGIVGIAQGALITASGLAQAAIVNAQPLPAAPQFAKGTDSSPATFIAGEKGRELMITKDGKAMLTPNNATLYDGLKNTKIFSNPETEKIMNVLNMANAGVLNNKQTIDQLNAIEYAVKESKSTMIFDKNGVIKYSRGSSAFATRVNKRFRN